jgi:hypothetical protein
MIPSLIFFSLSLSYRVISIDPGHRIKRCRGRTDASRAQRPFGLTCSKQRICWSNASFRGNRNTVRPGARKLCDSRSCCIAAMYFAAVHGQAETSHKGKAKKSWKRTIAEMKINEKKEENKELALSPRVPRPSKNWVLFLRCL